MRQPCGHVDFYPNNGKEQPGCDLTETPLPLTLIREGIEEASRVLVACNHIRAIKLFIDSINTECPYIAHRCDSYQHFLQVSIKYSLLLLQLSVLWEKKFSHRFWSVFESNMKICMNIKFQQNCLFSLEVNSHGAPWFGFWQIYIRNSILIEDFWFSRMTVELKGANSNKFWEKSRSIK